MNATKFTATKPSGCRPLGGSCCSLGTSGTLPVGVADLCLQSTLWLCLPASPCVAGSLISIRAWRRVSCRKSWYPWIRQLEKSLTERLFTEVWMESCRDTAVTRGGNSGSQPLNLGEGDGDRDRKATAPWREQAVWGGLWPLAKGCGQPQQSHGRAGTVNTHSPSAPPALLLVPPPGEPAPPPGQPLRAGRALRGASRGCPAQGLPRHLLG